MATTEAGGGGAQHGVARGRSGRGWWAMTAAFSYSTLAPFITEREMQDAIRVAALRNGWTYMHVYNSRRSPAGFPDVIAVKDGRMLVFELKKQSGRVAPYQRDWLEKFAAVPNCVAAIVRPIPRDDEMSYDEALELLSAGPGGSGRAE